MSERGNFLEQLTRDKEAVARLEVEVKTLKGKNLSLQEELEKAVHKLDIYNKVGLPLILFSNMSTAVLVLGFALILIVILTMKNTFDTV